MNIRTIMYQQIHDVGITLLCSQMQRGDTPGKKIHIDILIQQLGYPGPVSPGNGSQQFESHILVFRGIFTYPVGINLNA